MRLLGLLLAILMSGSGVAQVQVSGGSAMELADGTQLVFDISGPAQLKSFILNNPPRFVVDVFNARPADQRALNQQLRSADVQAVRLGIRNGNDLRIVVDLHDFVRSKSTIITKDRHHLVVDVFRNERLDRQISRVTVEAMPVQMISSAEPVLATVAPAAVAVASAPPSAPLPEPPPLQLTSFSAPEATPVAPQPLPATLQSAVAVAEPPPPKVSDLLSQVPLPELKPTPPPLPAAVASTPSPESTIPATVAVAQALGRDDTRPVPEVHLASASAPSVLSVPVALRNPPSRRDRLIIIDPGHGGKDPGAVGPKGTQEKHVVLAIAKRLAALINNEPGMRAQLTRSEDRYLKLYERINLARQKQADLFISIHADAIAGNPQAGGSSVYILSTSGASSSRARYLAKRENEADLVGGARIDSIDNSLKPVIFDIFHDAVIAESMKLAEIMIERLSTVGRVHKPRVERAGFAVLKSPDIPSILVETAFISNPREERQLTDGSFQRKIAAALLNGIQDYFKARPIPTWEPKQIMASTPSGRIHIVQPGESLTKIARRYQVPVARLRDANNLRGGDNIMAGGSLTIPGGGS